MLHLSPKWRAFTISTIAFIAIVPCFFLKPIPQSAAYHDFSDQRSWLGVANAANVLSNLPFLLVGTYGIVVVGRARSVQRENVPPPAASAAYFILFCGVTLTSLGSAYYPLAPSNQRLVWDRLPMSVGFMGLLSATFSERVSPRLGQRLLIPLVLIGLFSVLLWAWTESIGQGDLRLYYVVQFVSLLLVLAMALLFPSPYTRSNDILVSIAIYFVAKVCETKDAVILNALGVSGHTLKHMLAALSVTIIALMLAHRRPCAVAETVESH
jgi:hypothetical protein